MTFFFSVTWVRAISSWLEGYSSIGGQYWIVPIWFGFSSYFQSSYYIYRWYPALIQLFLIQCLLVFLIQYWFGLLYNWDKWNDESLKCWAGAGDWIELKLGLRIGKIVLLEQLQSSSSSLSKSSSDPVCWINSFINRGKSKWCTSFGFCRLFNITPLHLSFKL